MNYADILYTDTINGTGLRVSLFVSGCTIHCPGCFNQKTWDFDFGKPFTEVEEDKIIETIFNPRIKYSGLSLLGGEPLDNMKGLIPLLEKFKEKNIDGSKDVWIWTGRYMNSIRMKPEMVDFLRNYCDTIVAGPFVKDLKDLNLKFRGSANQLIYQVNKDPNNVKDFIVREDL